MSTIRRLVLGIGYNISLFYANGSTAWDINIISYLVRHIPDVSRNEQSLEEPARPTLLRVHDEAEAVILTGHVTKYTGRRFTSQLIGDW